MLVHFEVKDAGRLEGQRFNLAGGQPDLVHEIVNRRMQLVRGRLGPRLHLGQQRLHAVLHTLYTHVLCHAGGGKRCHSIGNPSRDGMLGQQTRGFSADRRSSAAGLSVSQLERVEDTSLRALVPPYALAALAVSPTRFVASQRCCASEYIHSIVRNSLRRPIQLRYCTASLVAARKPREKLARADFQAPSAGAHFVEENPQIVVGDAKGPHTHAHKQSPVLSRVEHSILVGVKLRKQPPDILAAVLVGRGTNPALHHIVPRLALQMHPVHLIPLLAQRPHGQATRRHRWRLRQWRRPEAGNSRALPEVVDAQPRALPKVHTGRLQKCRAAPPACRLV
mmetsp:Transcript_61622/g.52187  ORF Transcript_61622/g.52187 Transcript_61622/m.52187 type:complete len:337 (+) Transcript_61622:992-2002(+)